MYSDFYNVLPKLKNEGFDCIECINLDRNQMDEKFNDFINTNYQTKLIYYTGHGSMQNCREVLGKGALVSKVEDIKYKNLFIILNKCSVVSNLENLYCNTSSIENCCLEECIDLLKHNREKKLFILKLQEISLYILLVLVQMIMEY